MPEDHIGRKYTGDVTDEMLDAAAIDAIVFAQVRRALEPLAHDIKSNLADNTLTYRYFIHKIVRDGFLAMGDRFSEALFKKELSSIVDGSLVPGGGLGARVKNLMIQNIVDALYGVVRTPGFQEFLDENRELLAEEREREERRSARLKSRVRLV